LRQAFAAYEDSVFFADFHIHSKFSRATSKDISPEQLYYWAARKGIRIIGTGDAVHPAWYNETLAKLDPYEQGLYSLKKELQCNDDILPPAAVNPLFILTGEISCIYKKEGKTRKVHHLFIFPSFEIVEKFRKTLEKIGNIHSDGRPILGLDSRNLLEIALEISTDIELIPAHIWTPWFSIFGSKSGFDSIEECFDDLAGHIHALETGLSSDPPMNRLISTLDQYNLISNSDAHSLSKIGREATIFETKTDYPSVISAIRTGNGLAGTIEVFPEEGKYHYDGHRNCEIRLHPSETKKYAGKCPNCGKPVTEGVANRVYALADRVEPVLQKKFFSFIPIQEILSEILGVSTSSKKVISEYDILLTKLGPELNILYDIPVERIKKEYSPIFAEAVLRMREAKVIAEAGYDGEYGVIKVFNPGEKDKITGQEKIFDDSISRPKIKSVPVKEESHISVSLGPLATKPLINTKYNDTFILNARQLEAVSYVQGNIIIKAGPGTGKTFTLSHRIAFLMKNGLASPEQILALTFTRKATHELEQRVASLCEGCAVKISTFHSFCFDILREFGSMIGIPHDFILCSETDSKFIVDLLLTSNTDRNLASHLKKILPAYKRGFFLKASFSQTLPDKLKSYADLYQSWLKEHNMLDIDDLEVEALRLLTLHKSVRKTLSLRSPWIFVDEYQDTNLIQTEILKLLVNNDQNQLVNICAIGDDDQAIYGFRGASFESFNSFGNDFPRAVEKTLSDNYRSSRQILESASVFTDSKKNLRSMTGEGPKIKIIPCHTDSAEAEAIVAAIEHVIGGTSHFSIYSGRAGSFQDEDSNHISFSDIAILYRVHSQSLPLEEALSRAGIPHSVNCKTPAVGKFPISTIRPLLLSTLKPDIPLYKYMYLASLDNILIKNKNPINEKLLTNCNIESLIDQILQHHNFDISSDDAVEVLTLYKNLILKTKNLDDFYNALALERDIDNEPVLGDRVTISSIHAAKGLEWPIVFIVGCEESLIPLTIFGNTDTDEERRLFYVGMTRAKKYLFLTYASKRKFNGRVLNNKPSKFLSLLPEKHCVVEKNNYAKKSLFHVQSKLFQ